VKGNQQRRRRSQARGRPMAILEWTDVRFDLPIIHAPVQAATRVLEFNRSNPGSARIGICGAPSRGALASQGNPGLPSPGGPGVRFHVHSDFRAEGMCSNK
jgi:hypothetical protein